MNEGALPELPGGWAWTRLGEIIAFEYGKGLTADKREQKGDIPVYGSNGIVGYHSIPLIEKPCLIIGRKGAAGYVHISKVPCWAIDTTYYIIPPDQLNLVFLYFLLSTLNLNSLDKSTAIPGLNRNDAYALNIPLPPLPEQRAIVSKIEQLFSDLDNGINNFKKAQAQLKLYRQSVLKAACEGKLVPTEAELARAEGRDYEAADVLLARILKERREKWNGKGKYKEAAAPDTNELLELPEGWCLANVRMISEKIQYGTSEKAGEDNSGIPVLRMGNIQDGKLNLENLKYFPKEWSELNDYILQDGDVLFNRTNSAELVGKTSVYKKHHPPAVFASYLIRVRVIENAYNPDLLCFFINSIFGRKYIGSVVSQQVGQANVNGTKLSQMPIPFPPLAEQRRIVAEVERRLSVSDKMEETITESLLKAVSLRQSFLKKAFEGKLLDKKELEKARNAPDWEPAEKLLERIKAEKVKAQKNACRSGE